MNARRPFLRRIYMVLMAFVILAQLPCDVSAQTTTPDQQSFLLGTGSTEGTYHPVGVALSTLIKLKLLPSLKVDLNAINTDGSQENVDLMRQDDVQFAILSALSSHQAQRGTGSFVDLGPNENLRAITTLWSSTDHIIIKDESVQSGMIKDVLALRGQKMSFGRPESGTLLGNRAMTAPLGIDLSSDFNLVELGFAESAKAFVDGDIVGMGLSGGVPIGAVQDLFNQVGDNAAFLEFSDDQLALIDQGRRIWARSVIPANTYNGQSRDIFTIGAPNILAVRADIDDEVVYQITRTIFENLDYLHNLHRATQQISLDTAIDNLPLPVHEGALRYFAEKGVELPPPPVEVNSNLLARFDNAAEAREIVNQGRISIFSGASGDTSSRIAAELATALNSGDDGVRLLPTYGGGSAQNLTDLLYLQGVDSALVRTDVVAYAEEQGIYPDITDKIAYITEMFPEEVHLIVADGIDDVRDLKGKKVDVGLSGSGTDVTASIILSQLDIPVDMTNFGSHAALDRLKRGEISGAFFVGGKPMPLLSEIGKQSGLNLLSIPFIQFADSYRPTSINARDYPNLIDVASNEDVSTLAVRTALVTYQWRPGTARYQTLATFSDAFFDHLRDLNQDGNHPKWREVDPTAEILGWQRFESAGNWVSNNFEAAQRIALEGQLLIDRSLLAPLIADNEDLMAPPASLDAAFAPPADPKPESEAGAAEPAVPQDEVKLPDAGGILERLETTPLDRVPLEPATLESTISEPGSEEPADDPTPEPTVAKPPLNDEKATPKPATAESLTRSLGSEERSPLSPSTIQPLPNTTVNVPTF